MKLQPAPRIPPPRYPTHASHHSSIAWLKRAAAITGTSLALLIGGCSGCDTPVRTAGSQAPVANPEPVRPPGVMPVTNEPPPPPRPEEPIRLSGDIAAPIPPTPVDPKPAIPKSRQAGSNALPPAL